MPMIRLPVVRVRPLPAVKGELAWREGPDRVAAGAALAVAGVGLVLAVSALAKELSAEVLRGPILTGAVLLAVPCVVALVLGLGELRYRWQVSVRDGQVRVRERSLGGERAWSAPIADFDGLVVRDRGRRLFLRNQDRPPTGRRGPVSEFVIVLRHGSERSRDLELFRGQPSLETLRAMHALNAAATSTSRTLAARACEDLADSYREALRTLARRLRVAVLKDTPGGWQRVDPQRLDRWLEPPGRRPEETTLDA